MPVDRGCTPPAGLVAGTACPFSSITQSSPCLHPACVTDPLSESCSAFKTSFCDQAALLDEPTVTQCGATLPSSAAVTGDLLRFRCDNDCWTGFALTPLGTAGAYGLSNSICETWKALGGSGPYVDAVITSDVPSPATKGFALACMLSCFKV